MASVKDLAYSGDIVHGGACWKCKTPLILPRALYEAARTSESISVYCAYGHSGCYPGGPTRAEQLQAELDRAYAANAQTRAALADERHRHAATKGQLTKTKNRAKAGMCTECRRTFQNVARHMKTQHGAE